jgi:preprotein translocase subunit SecD
MLRNAPGDAKAVQAKVVYAVEVRLSLLHGAEATVRAKGTDEVEIMTAASAAQVVSLLTMTGSIAFATAAPGAPDANNRSFVRDQGGRFDPKQFGDPLSYPSGYHWRIDPHLQASNVLSADACTDQSGQWALCISFDSAGAAEWSAITNEASLTYSRCNPASPPAEARVAIFLDRQY